MVDGVAEIGRFSSRDAGILSRVGFTLYRVGSGEIAIPNDDGKVFVPGTFGKSLRVKEVEVARVNRELQAEVGIGTIEVFWGGLEDISALLYNNPDLPGVLGMLREDVRFDTSSRLTHQYMASMGYTVDTRNFFTDQWCDCGYASDGVLLTVRPKVLSQRTQ